jgi:DNA/RNA endonuclease G (NUC1)
MSKSKLTTLQRVILSIAIAVSATYFLVTIIGVRGAGNPSVVVNKYFNNGTADIVELLVIQNNLDMRGMILKDFSANMVNDGGGKIQFSNNALWTSVPAGTLIVLRNGSSAATDTTVGGGDYNLDIGLQNATYFTSAGGSFDIAAIEEVMIKAAGSGAAGVTGSIHALAGGTAGAQFTSTAVPKLIATGQSGTGQFVFANNSTQSINDFDGTDATGAATGLTFGAGNNANNTAYINSLRGVTSTAPSGTGTASPNSVLAGASTLLTVNVTPGTNPTSTGLAVTADLSSIGGSASQAFSGGGNTFTFTATVANGTSGGNKSLPFTITETNGLGRTGSGLISLTVLASTNPSGTGTANPTSVFQGNSTVLTVNVTPGTNPTSTGLAVVADLSSIGGSASQSFAGSGNTFTFTATVSVGATPGSKTLPFTITDAQSRSGAGSISLTVQTPPVTNNVVISQVYGGGGNNGSTLTNDYIELINHSSSPVNLSGWSVQAFVSTTGTWQITPLTSVSLLPGQYYLIQESQGAGGTDPLPTPDAFGTIPVSSTSTKVALVNNTTLITAACPNAGIVDLVGYGPTDCFEGSGTAPLLSNTTAAIRLNGGCFDTNDNSVDFVTGAPSPHNTLSATHDCTGLSATGSANPSTVLQGTSTTLTVHVAPAQNPDSSGLTVTADLSLIGGSASQPFSGSGTTFNFVATVPANNPSGMKSLPVTVADGQGRTGNTSILVSVLSTTPEHVTISQVYGGGGNAGATYQNDYVELYNPTAATITMTGWSLQYAAATGTSFAGKQVLGGTIDPGHYYLVSLASQGPVGAPLPPASVSGTDINMAGAAGKIVLVSNSDTLSGACPLGTDPDIVDFVGYGTTANCHEGTANAPAPSNTTAIFRKTGGGTDTDQNGNDFVVGTPNPRSTTPVVEFGPSVAGTDPSTNDTIAPYDSSITADFSEPVDAVGAWYNVTCTITGLHNNGTVAHSADFKTWAFTPNTTFQFGEQCTATIYKNQIHDQDTDDSGPNTDTLSADYVWSFTVVGAGQAAPYPPSVHLTMGNPSNAVADVSQPLNYLMMKPTYAVSYNRDKGTPNWVSWHLDPSWYGTLVRVDTFRPDPAVDPSWYRVQAFDYSGTGFDRGHMTPNADRDNQNRIPINQETYLMSNMVPQAPDNNQGPWANLEADLRTLADGGNELYIVSGPLGVGGTGSASGNTVNTIANGHVTVPAYTWKVVLVLPSGSGDDVSRVTCSTRTIAVLMPNTQGIRNTPWQNFLTTVDVIEHATGYDLYSNLPPAVQACVEAGTNGVNPPGTADQSASTQEYTPVTITLQALRSNTNTLAFSVVNGPAHGSLGSMGATSCTGGSCTATVSYTPGPNYNGPDSFTFRASDGSTNSNVSTVSITVTKATATINVSGYTGVYDGNAHGATGSATGVNGEDLTSLLDFGASFTNVSGGTAHWTFAGNENYLPSSGDATVTITKAPSTTTVTCPASQTYTGSAIEPCTASYSGAGGLSGSLTPIYSNNVNVGSPTASASFGGDANHDGSTGNGGFTITKASTTTTVTCPASETYTGSAFEPCTASYSGAGGLSGSLTPIYENNINAGSATASATFGGDANHDGSTGSGGFTIAKASTTTTVICPASQTYTGSAIEPCTGSYSGAGGLSGSLTPVYSTNINAGSATASATFGGDTNHESSTGNGGFTITKASTTTTVTCPASQTYTGAAIIPCSATVTGANLNLAPGASYANNTNVGTAAASYNYDGDSNHEGSSDSKNFEITKAATVTTVTCPASQTYTGAALTPCSVTVTGANLNLTPGANYLNNTDVGTATASYTFAGDLNHDGSSDSKNFQITRASTTTTVTCPTSETYTGAALTPCSVAVTGANLNLTPGASYANNTNVGTATASYTFAGDSNHDGSSDSKTFAITRASTTTTVTCPPSETYTGAALTP